MRARNGAGAGSVEHDARLLIVLAGKRDDHTVSPQSHKTQLKFPRADFARELTRAIGLLMARPHSDFLSALHRAETDDGALSDAAVALDRLPALTRRRVIATYAALGRAAAT